MNKRKALTQIAVSFAFTALVTFFLIQNWSETARGLSQVSLAALAALVGLQIISYIVRVRAWGLSLQAAGARFDTGPLHTASGATFLINCFVPMYLGQWLRILLLRRQAQSPTIGQMAVADAVSLFVEVVIVFLILIVAVSALPFGIWPLLAMGAISLLGGALVFHLLRSHGHRPWTHSLRIFSGSRRTLFEFIVLLCIVVGVQPIRFYLALEAIGDPKSLALSALAFIATCISAILPIGPAASSVSGMAATTGSSLPDAIAASLLLAAAALIAAIFYLMGSLVVYGLGSRGISSKKRLQMILANKN